MRKTIFLNPGYGQYKDFVENIPENFDKIGDLIHEGRNCIRSVNIDGTILVIKYFKKVTIANRFIYAHIRKSKARRAYEHSMSLLEKGITTPQPVAYADCVDKGLLVKSYYICLYTDYRPIEEMIALPIKENEEGLRAFARFSYRLHKNGIFHDDFNTSNTLFRISGNVYDFSLIDNNRIRFCRYTYINGVKNMKRFEMPAEVTGIVAAEYASESGANPIKTLNAITFYRVMFIEKVFFKKVIKSLKKLI